MHIRNCAPRTSRVVLILSFFDPPLSRQNYIVFFLVTFGSGIDCSGTEERRIEGYNNNKGILL